MALILLTVHVMPLPWQTRLLLTLPVEVRTTKKAEARKEVVEFPGCHLRRAVEVALSEERALE